jgi:hypothetical protein
MLLTAQIVTNATFARSSKLASNQASTPHRAVEPSRSSDVRLSLTVQPVLIVAPTLRAGA